MIQVNLKNDVLYISFKGDKFKETLELVRKYKCLFNPPTKEWIYKGKDYQILKELRYIDREITFNDSLSKYLEEKREIKIFKPSPINGQERDIEGLNIKLFPHQFGDVDFLTSRSRALLASTMGVGKTIGTIGALLYLKQLKYINNCLITAPKSVLKEWKYMIDNNTDYKSNIIKGSNRKFTYDNFFNLISFDSLSNDIYTKLTKKDDPETWLKTKNKLNEASKYDCLIIDEAHLCCNPKSLRSKALRRLCKNIKYVYCLTATPIVNTLDNMYNIFNMFLVPNIISYTEYRYKYCVFGGWMGNQVVGYKNFDKFVQLIQPYTRRILKSQVSDKFPKKTESIRWIDLHKEQMNFYNNVKKQLIEIPYDHEKEIKIKRAQELALISYLKQACILTNLIDNSTNYSSKIDECLKIIDEKIANKEKVVVYCFYLKACEYLQSLLAKKYGVLYLNSDNSKDIDKIKEEFKKDENQVLIMTKTGQVGLNLEMASCFIFLTLEWTHASLVQLYSRIDRITQTKPIEIIYLIANNTYEERIFDIINYKKSLSENITDKLISLNKSEKQLIMENI